MNCKNMQFQTNSCFYVFFCLISVNIVMNYKKKKPFSYSFQR